MWPVEKPGKLFGDCAFLPALHLEQHVLLGGEVEDRRFRGQRPAAATIAPTSAAAMPDCLNSAIAAAKIRCRVCSRRA